MFRYARIGCNNLAVRKLVQLAGVRLVYGGLASVQQFMSPPAASGAAGGAADRAAAAPARPDLPLRNLDSTPSTTLANMLATS